MAAIGEMTVKVVPDVSEFISDLEHAVPNGLIMQIMRRAAQDLLFQYSEWLDSQGNIRSENESGDTRSHDQLVTDFLKQD